MTTAETIVSRGRSAIDREVETLKEYIATAESYAPEAEIADALVAEFPQHDLRCSIGVGPHVLNGFLIMVDLHRLDEAKALVSWLSQRLGKFDISDFPELGRRTYDWKRLKLSAFFNSFDAKTVCKFVEVGKEEKPVYKLMCGDEAHDATASNA